MSAQYFDPTLLSMSVYPATNDRAWCHAPIAYA